MGQPVKIAIAGAGYGAKVALPGYTKLDEFETVAVWSRRAERARQVATDYGLALGTSDFEELLAFPGLEAIHIATPVVTHLPSGLAAARRRLLLLFGDPLG